MPVSSTRLTSSASMRGESAVHSAPLARTQVRALAAIVGCDVHPINNRRILQTLRKQFGADEAAINAWCATWITAGFDAIEALLIRRVPFTLEGDELHLTREGGHSARRIVHATDATGAAVQKTLMEVVRSTPGITVFEHHTLVWCRRTQGLWNEEPFLDGLGLRPRAHVLGGNEQVVATAGMDGVVDQGTSVLGQGDPPNDAVETAGEHIVGSERWARR